MIPGALQAHKRRDKINLFHVVSITIAVFICSACMLIRNNNQPLGCVFKCDIFSTNFTYVCNHEKGYHGARITSLNVSFLPDFRYSYNWSVYSFL